MHVVCVHRGMVPERYGGTYSYIYELYRRLVARGHTVDIIASTRERDAGPPTDIEGMLVHRYSFLRVNPILSTLQHLSNTYRIYAEIAAKRPVDLLSIHDSQLGFRLARSPQGRAVCQVSTFHAPAFLEFRLNTAWDIEAERSAVKRLWLRATERPLEEWQRRFERGVLEAADGVVILSEYIRRNLEEHFPTVDLNKVRIVPSGVDVERFRPATDREAVRARLGFDRDTLYLVTARKLAPRMGLENLVRAMPLLAAEAAKRRLKVRLTICGSGWLLSTLEALVRDVGVGDTVTLAGRVSDDDLVRHYQAADLFVLPTTAMEGFGISTIEALATNLPVVGTPAGATPEILGAIDRRLLSADTSPAAIADAVARWFDWRADDVGTTRYRDEAVAKYSWDRVTGIIENYYAEKVERFGRGHPPS